MTTIKTAFDAVIKSKPFKRNDLKGAGKPLYEIGKHPADGGLRLGVADTAIRNAAASVNVSRGRCVRMAAAADTASIPSRRSTSGPREWAREIRIGDNDLVAMAKVAAAPKEDRAQEKWMDASQHSRSFTC